MSSTDPTDFFDELGELALGSRVKRLGERVFAQGAEIYARQGLDFEARWFPLVSLLDRHGAIAVGEAAKRLGLSQPAVSQFARQLESAKLVEFATDSEDARRRLLTLSPKGRDVVTKMRPLWSAIEDACIETCIETGIDLETALASFESALTARSLADRVSDALGDGVRIVGYRPELRSYFRDINLEWVSAMFEVEAADRLVFEDPQTHILDPGGQIWFAEHAELGVVGTCALKRASEDEFELSKMGVLERARGRKVGEKLLRRVIYEGYRGGARRIFLLTNHRCEAAIHLYEKHGFERSPEYLERYGAVYARSNVAMVHRGSRPK